MGEEVEGGSERVCERETVPKARAGCSRVAGRGINYPRGPRMSCKGAYNVLAGSFRCRKRRGEGEKERERERERDYPGRAPGVAGSRVGVGGCDSRDPPDVARLSLPSAGKLMVRLDLIWCDGPLPESTRAGGGGRRGRSLSPKGSRLSCKGVATPLSSPPEASEEEDLFAGEASPESVDPWSL